MNRTLTLLIGFIIPLKLFAVDLMDIYKDALEYDAIFKESYSKYMSISENIAVSRAALYPSLSINSSIYRTAQNVFAQGFGLDATYNSHQWNVSASQAIFNYQAWARLKEAKDSVKSAEASFFNAAQDLMLRTSKAYFDILLAKDTLKFAIAKKRANKRQVDQASERVKVGLDSITSVYEAKAAYNQSIAEVIAARNNLLNQQENLRKITMHRYPNLAKIRHNMIPLVRPEPSNVDVWIDTGLRQNYNYLSKKYALSAARENVKSISAGSWPTFALEANSGIVRNILSQSNFFAPNYNKQANIALTFNFPVVQGGLVQAQTRQAQYDFQVVSEQMEQSYRDVLVNTQIAFNTIVDGISKVRADRETVIAQEKSLKSTEEQFQVGTRTMVDVVLAQQRLFEAQRELAQDQYGLINANLQLKYLSGTLNSDDLALVNSWLRTTKIQGLPPH